MFFHRQSLNDNIPKINNKYPGHVGIYLGDKKFIHAIKSEKQIVISDFNKNEYWNNVLVGYKDIVTLDLIKRKILKQ